MKFNEYIKQLRMKHFKDLEKFCKILGVEKTMWRKIERGINPPPRKTLLKKFANLTHMFSYEESQMYELARRWEPSPDTQRQNGEKLLLKKTLQITNINSGSIH